MIHCLRSKFGIAVLAILVVAFLSAATGDVRAQQAQEHEGQAHATATAEKLPAARDVIDDYVEALGGEKALRKVKSMTMVGKLDIPAAGISGSLEIRAMAPNKILVTSEIPGMGQILDGFDGKVGWSIDPTMGARLKEGGELTQARFQSEFYGMLHADDRYKSMETVEKTDVDGAACYKLRLVTRDGEEIFEYFDAASGLQVGTELQAETAMGAVTVFSKIGEYRQVGALKLPASLKQTMGPMEQIMTFSDLSVNDVDPAVFDLPAEIRALTEE